MFLFFVVINDAALETIMNYINLRYFIKEKDYQCISYFFIVIVTIITQNKIDKMLECKIIY